MNIKKNPGSEGSPLECKDFTYRTPRVRTSFPVVIQSDPHSKSFSGQCVQVSGDGMALALPDEFPPGKKLIIIVDHTTSGRPLTVEGIVVHSGAVHGVVFTELTDGERRELSNLSTMP